MAEKDKKLKVILKLPKKSSSRSKAGTPGAPLSPSATSQKLNTSSVVESETPLKPSSKVLVPSANANSRVATPPKKRKFKTLVEGDAKDDLGGAGGVSSTTEILPVFKAPLPPFAKKPSHKKKEKPINGETEAPLSSLGKGQGASPAPAKKVLEGVLDKLKKKDTYGVFSEPVDANLVPDYYDVIKEPMDFGTMYKKISKGLYYTLSLFEKDIMLICNNAMRYNGPETVYYKQARSIQDAARKALDVIASQAGAAEAGAAKPAANKKQAHPSKKAWTNAAAAKTVLEPANSDFASGASLAAEGEAQSNKHDVVTSKRGAQSDRSGSVAGEEPGYGVQSQATAAFEPDADVQDEQGAQQKPATLKDGRRPPSTEEYHRSTYKPRNLPAHGRGPPLAGVGGELHHLVPTGYQSEMAYAKSLSRFSARLGPEGWKFAAQRLQRVLAPSVPFGQGWIGVHEAPPGTIFRKFPSDAKVTNVTRINQNFSSTAPSNLLGGPSSSYSPVTSAYVPVPKSSRPLTINPAAQSAMDSSPIKVTSAMLVSGAASQVTFPGRLTMESVVEKPSQPVYQLERSRS